MLSTQYQFSFYKKPQVEASCPYSLIGTLWRASEAPEERVPVGSGLLGSPPYHLDRTIHSIHTLCSTSICLLLLLTTAQECLTAGRIKAATGTCVQVCSRVCVFVSKRDSMPLSRGVCMYTINKVTCCSTYMLTFI